MKITTLIENSLGYNKELIKEHGISFFIETSNGNILFDTGQTGSFIENAKKLGVNLNKTNYLVLSHSHYDHCGGVKRLLEEFNINPNLYIGEKFFINSNRYHYTYKDKKTNKILTKANYKYIGIDFNEQYIKDKNIDINYIKENVTNIIDNVYIFSNFQKIFKYEELNPNMKIKVDNNYVTDSFGDEIVLGVDTKKGMIILVGCSHVGILNIVKNISKMINKNIYAVIGGTHLIEANDERVIMTIEELETMNIKLIGVSHCTGERAINLFKEKGENFFKNTTGTVIEV